MTETTSPHLREPTSPEIKAAQELELPDDGDQSDDESDVFQDISDSNSSPSKIISTPPLVISTPVNPSAKSKVRAAAAMWEKDSSPTPTPTSAQRPRLSPSPASSFRSIPVSSTNGSPTKLTPEKQPSRSPSLSNNRSPTKSPNLLHLNSPFVVRAPSPSPTPSPGASVEHFSDVPLSGNSPRQALPLPEAARSYAISPSPPRPVDLPEPVTTPPAKEPVKSSFFSSALGFGFPSGSTSTGVTAEPASVSQEPSRSASASSHNQSQSAGGGWRSTMTNLLTSRSTSSASPLPQSPEALASASTVSEASSSHRPAGPARNQSNQGAALLLHRISSSTASRDRRISQQMGGGEKLREGFERVRSEMESAAREMRRERDSQAAAAEQSEDGENVVDWVFWGAVVQDFEEVARSNPKQLSKAIQQGIPPVIRGAIWQLMSSSKSPPLEETYKSLLKLQSPHEKAIAKDINRTFPNHKFFQEGGGVGQESLFMVVKAYSLYDQDVGYTQGIAFVVAALLLNMPDEEAFCVLVRLMDSYNLRSHYTAEMQGLQLRLFQFDRLVEEILPLIHTHFVRKGIKSSMYASQWFMTMFSYRFPLCLVYRVLDIVFAEGIEAIFRFSIALLRKSEDKLLELNFEEILNYLQTDLFEIYRADDAEGGTDSHDESEWKANDFVRDAYGIRITQFMLDSYASEWEEQCRSQNKHALEVDQLRNANRNLSAQVKQLEASLSTINQEHVDLVRQLVMCKIEKEETENELVRYKMLYAEMAHAQQDALSTHSRLSAGSLHGP